ncbi:helix-turn-helix transcriptional regulator [Carboxydochorda subterranea]|uniref:Helix-turn-helix transcriptional regulator n=1 Tax=Carboxydichorda subterranea TaxID=3109565 RepID=A0ABZ1C1P2_9FIRM|nr:helix-turn-helix transcriptional regulator [Limnochorda sp. L945t]WRP18721.1 helix-turn-helix transcriptional regulator [Limnochorda sp. L945t]
MESRQQELGRYLRALRRQQNLTQEQLAEKAGIHPTFISRIEGGRAMPSLDVLTRLAGALGVSAADVLRATLQPGQRSGQAEDLRAEIHELLAAATPQQVRLVRDFVVMVLQGRHCAGPELGR